jgi:hypothetical protein
MARSITTIRSVYRNPGQPINCSWVTLLDPGYEKSVSRCSRACECIPIRVLETCLIVLASCPMRGRFLEAILQRTERELAGPGRPGPVDGLVAKVERREAPRPTSLGARGRLAARGGYVNPASRVLRHCALAPPAAPSPRAVREGLANLGRIAPRECGSLAV